jgi:2-polyprenyl-3-methyl-5-hydroxy-6-metoxy-1,4-benzoquinol methylase
VAEIRLVHAAEDVTTAEAFDEILAADPLPTPDDHSQVATLAALTNPHGISVYSTRRDSGGPQVFLAVQAGRVLECVSPAAALVLRTPAQPTAPWPPLTLRPVQSRSTKPLLSR